MTSPTAYERDSLHTFIRCADALERKKMMHLVLKVRLQSAAVKRDALEHWLFAPREKEEVKQGGSAAEGERGGRSNVAGGARQQKSGS